MTAFKMQKDLTPVSRPEDLGADHLELFLREAERALMLVDARLDEPGGRFFDGLALEEAYAPEAVARLSLTIAELLDMYPNAQQDIDALSDRMRITGAAAAALELSRRRHLLDVVRLSLEAMFTMCPDLSAYITWVSEEDHEGDVRSPAEIFHAYREILSALRQNLN